MGGNGRAGAEERADFRRTYHSAVCRRARPTAVESHWSAARLWSGCGRNMGVCQPRSVRVALIYVLVQGLTVRPRLG